MTIALWCLLVAAFLHMPFVGLAKAQRSFDNASPRDYAARLEGWRKRAYAAQLNQIESFPFFAAAVLVAEMLDAPQGRADLLAIGYIVLRVVYGVMYVIDQPTLRSASWVGAAGCAIALFVAAA